MRPHRGWTTGHGRGIHRASHLPWALLAQRRREAGLSRPALARLIGRTRATIADYEHGRNAPSALTLGMVAAALGCEVGDLYSRGDDAVTQADLTAAQRDGTACIRCGLDYLREVAPFIPHVPVGRCAETGVQTFVCASCPAPADRHPDPPLIAREVDHEPL